MADAGTPVPFVDDDEDDQPQYSAAVTALSGTGRAPVAAAPAVPQQQPAQAPSQPTQYGMPAIPVRQPMPQAPVAPTVDTQAQQQAINDAKARTVNQADYKPKWYERLAGGLAAAGIGYRDPAAGVEIGSGITNRRYNSAVSDEQSRQKAAQQNVQNMKDAAELARDNYGIASQQYGNVMRGREVGDEEGNQDFQQGMEVHNSAQNQNNSDRDYNRETANDTFGHNMVTQQFGEEQKQHGIENKNRQTELGIDQQRLQIDQDKAAQDKTNAKGDALKRQIQMNRLNTARQSQLTALDANDPKSGDAGYVQQRQSLWTSTKNPDTDQKWKPGEREQAVAALDADHADKKNAIESNFAQGMQNLGINVVPVTYGPDGKTVVNNSDGNAPSAPRQQAAPPQQAAAAPPPRGTQPPQQGARRPTPSGMARVQKPDGSTVFIPKANIARAKAIGGKVLDQGQ